jgi:hypothetical protein
MRAKALGGTVRCPYIGTAADEGCHLTNVRSPAVFMMT